MQDLFARVLVVVLTFGVAISAGAQVYPAKPIQLVVPFTPGGGMSDRVARLIADKLCEKWGQPGVVENRPGASANIGGEYVAKAAPDGYTGVGSTPEEMAQFLKEETARWTKVIRATDVKAE